MSPAERATAADLARLAAEIERDQEAMARCSADAAETLAELAGGRADRRALIVGGVGLHGWYTALETALGRIARTIDASVPSGSTSHRDLLSQAMTAIEGVRPAVLDRSLEADLLALLAFRHFFRHAYGVELDPARLRLELERHARRAPGVHTALTGFRAFLDGARAALVAS